MTKITDGPTGGWLSFTALMTLALALSWFATGTPTPAPANAPSTGSPPAGPWAMCA